MPTMTMAALALAWKGCAYTPEDMATKNRFHRLALVKLHTLALALGWSAHQFDLRSNKGGIAVSGEITLHGERLHIQVGWMYPGLRILARTCDGRKDYCGHRNQYFAIELLDKPQELAAKLKELVTRRFGETSGAEIRLAM